MNFRQGPRLKAYSRVLHTHAQSTLDFVKIVDFWLSQTLEFSQAELPEALPVRQPISCPIMHLTHFFSQSIHFENISMLIYRRIDFFWLRTSAFKANRKAEI